MTSHHLNRRAILAGAASVAAPVPALAVARDQASSTPSATAMDGRERPDVDVEDDPIFAAIEAREATWAALSGACEASEDGSASRDLCVADDDAVRALLVTQPTTMAGIRALLAYVVKCERAEDGEFLNLDMEDDADGRLTGGGALARTLLAALEGLA